MNYKFNLKFFKGSVWPVPVGSAMILIGVIPLILELIGANGMYLILTAGVMLAVVGAILIAFSSGGRSNEADFDEQIKRSEMAIVQTALKQFSLEEKHIKVIPLYDPYQFGEFDFTDGEGLLVKAGKDGKYRSSVYLSSLFMFTAEKLCFFRHRFSFINEYSEYFTDAIPYLAIDSIYISDASYKVPEKGNEIKYNLFNVKTTDGKVISSPVHSAADIDDFILKVMKLVNQKKAQAKA